MSERARNIITLVALGLAALVVVTLVATSPSAEDRVTTLGQQIKCPVCQGESIGDSPATMARDMMALVEERVAAGASDQEIIDELLSSYSGAVLLDPPAGGNTLILWLAPFVVLVAGAAVIIWWRSHPGRDGWEPDASPPRARRLAGGLILIVAFAGAAIIAALSVQDRAGPAAGVAGQEVDNLDDVSDETIEAVIAANLDNPQISGMRLALAERYYEANDYHAAFPHYLAVAQADSSTQGEAVTALIRLGWMAWDGNGEAEAAVGLLDQALDIDPGSSTAMFLKAQVLWCGLDDPTGAATLLGDVLEDPDITDDSRARVSSDIDAITAGRACP